MKHLIIYIVTLLLSSSLMAQGDTLFIKYDTDLETDSIIYTTDTVVFRSSMTRHYLIGTTTLPSTHNQIYARSWGLFLSDVSKSDCKKHSNERRPGGDKVIDVNQTDTSYIIDINIYDNCCYDFLCDMSVDSTGTLNLIYKGYGSHCACNCCFGLKYHIEKWFDSDKGEIKAIIINGDERTRKTID